MEEKVGDFEARYVRAEFDSGDVSGERESRRDAMSRLGVVTPRLEDW